MIRWGRLAFLITPLVLIWAGTHFFLDRGIRSAIQSVGSAAVGARVDVGGVNTNFWRLSATVRDLAVTDPDAPMTNAVEIQTVRLKVQLKPLFWKKIIVDQAEILGVRTGTPRRTSGALPKKSPAQEEPSAVAQKAKEVAGMGLENLKEAYDPKKLASPENLASYKKAMAERERLTSLAETWKTRSQKIDTQGLVRRVQEFSNKVKGEKFSGAEGLKKAQPLLKEGQSLEKEIAAAQKDLKGLGADLAKEVQGAKSTIKDIDQLRRQDLSNAIAQIKSGFSTEGITKGLLGPAWFDKLEKALGWIGTARRLTGGDTKTAPAAPPPAREGRDIPFPFHERWPTFHLVRAALSGQTPGELAYQGTLSDVSSDPKILGKPTLLDLSGKSGERTLEARASLDMTTETPKETLRAEYGGLPLAGIKLGSLGNGSVSIAAGQGTVKTDLAIEGNTVNGWIDLHAVGIALDQSVPGKEDRLSLAVQNILKGINDAQIKIRVTGTFKAPQFAVTSSMDNQLRGALQGALDQQTAQIRADIEKQINSLVGKETEKLSSLVDKNGGAALEKLNLGDKDLADVQAKIKKALEDLASSGTKGFKVPDLKGLFKKK